MVILVDGDPREMVILGDGVMDCVKAEELRSGLESVNVDGQFGRI